MSKIKVNLHDATKLLAAGLTVEHWLILDEEKEREDKQPESLAVRGIRAKKKKRMPETTDETKYRIGAKEIMPGKAKTGKAHKGVMLIRTLFNNDLVAVRTRKQITDAIQGPLALTITEAVRMIAELRRSGYLKLVNDG